MTSSAPGKAILLGEHAVVYGRPAIAVPVHALQASATLKPADRGEPGQLWIEAPDIGLSSQVELHSPAAATPQSQAENLAPAGSSPVSRAAGREQIDRAPESQAAGLATAVRLGLEHFGGTPAGALRLEVHSDLPVAAGMGSSAAVTVAVLRAVAEHLGQQLAPEAASRLAYEVERHYHGQPSGIDNTVVALGAPIYYVRERPPSTIAVGAPFTLVLADSGRPASTRELVAGVRQRWEADPASYERLFDEIGAAVEAGRTAIEGGRLAELGQLMTHNQLLLEQIGVSTPLLETLITAGLESGAWGAKLSGAGGGGLVLAVADAGLIGAVRTALLEAGAVRAFVTEVGS